MNESTARALVPEGRLTRSSLIGQDMCGDKTMSEPEGSDASSDEEAEEPKETADDADSPGDEKKKKKKEKEKVHEPTVVVARSARQDVFVPDDTHFPHRESFLPRSVERQGKGM